jgi:hypothetical protein
MTTYIFTDLEDLAKFFDKMADNVTPFKDTKREHERASAKKAAFQQCASVVRNCRIGNK